MSSPATSWASSEAARRTMQANRSRDTRPEMRLRQAAHALGLRYRVSVRPLPWFRRTADLVFTRVRLAVFVDGCFWHGCPTHHTTAKANGEYWSSKVRRNRERDAETTAVLQEHGWTVLRFWEHEDLRASAREVATVYHGLRESHSHDTALAAAAARTHLQGSIRIGSQVTELGSGGSNER